MKKLMFPAFLVCTILAVMGIQSFQQSPETKIKEQQLIAKTNEFNMLFPQEKVYLHLDRPSYWAGEDIWFKAYLKNPPVTASNFYVELLNASGKVIRRSVCWVENGLSYGDLHLADMLSSGMYQVRAYTNWMRNFGEEQFFRKDLVIWNLRDRDRKSEPVQLKSREIDFQFMPEGGVFLAGVENRLAFKVTDRNGKGLFAEGVVVDDKGNEVATIKTGYKGMGCLAINPQPGAKYTAKMTVAGNISQTVELPIAATSGVVMRINPEDTSRIQIEVAETGLTAPGKYTVIGQREGSVCYRGEILTAAGKGQLSIDKSKFPTGIIRLTLFDANILPRCERLVFVNHHDQVEVKIGSEKQSYGPREKVVLDLDAMSKGELPAIASLSLSVYHTETNFEPETYPENILTRFLISSELKGRIEEPAYYFKDDSLSTILALDNLLLTHGYRYFEWKEIAEDKRPEISYEPDSSIQLGGQVTTISNHNLVKNGKVSLMTVKTLLNAQTAATDEKGRFLFSGLYFTDTIDVVLHAVNEKGRKNTFIEIDKILNATPAATILPLKYEYRNEQANKSFAYFAEPDPAMLMRKWRLSDTIVTRDINVVARKKEQDDGHTRPYKTADFVFDVGKKDNVYRYLLDMLDADCPVWRSFMQMDENLKESLSFRDLRTHYFLNGTPCENYLEEILKDSPNNYDKVEFVKMASIPGLGFSPAVYFYTKRGAPNRVVEEPSGSTSVRLAGYSLSRKFYSPMYDGIEDPDNKKKDSRSTLYWNPIVRTDTSGRSEVSFYNSDQTGEVKVVVEGVSKDGKLCRGEYKYDVVPK